MPDLDEQIREFIDSGAMPVTAAEVIASHQLSPSTPGVRYRYPRRMRSYAIGATAMAAAICVLVVVLVFGVASSSKPTVNTPSRPAGVPATWQKVTFGGLTMYAPGNWPTVRNQVWGSCGIGNQPFKVSSVVLDTGVQSENIDCPMSGASLTKPVYGLLIDPGQYGPLVGRPMDPGFDPGNTGFDKCLEINALSVCPTSAVYISVMIVAVHIPGVTRPVVVEIGLAGGGKVAHTILYSMRPSASGTNVKKNTPPLPAAWSSALVVRTNPQNVRQIVQIPGGVYFLSGVQIGSPEPSTAFRYDPATGRVTRGPTVTGLPGDIAFAGGWLWFAVGQGQNVAIYQLDPSTLSVHAHFSLRVKDNPASFGGTVNPTLAAAMNGPLWVDGGEDLWGLNPSTGAIETEFNTRTIINYMSIDPTGNYLYAAAQGAQVIEYNATNGTQLYRSQYELGEVSAIGVETVATTDGGVWVSYRGGNAGDSEELSQSGLRRIAGPTWTKGTDPLGVNQYGYVGGVGSAVIDGVLWLSSQHGFACADPQTGDIRAYNHEGGHPAPAPNHLIYGTGAQGIVATTPPAACFG
jgi:hypothetical protein